ncbi:MAG: Gfo/Idh/MocA family oxidoreductase [Acidobacteriota bacterium]|nr:Gfo/Idh/MocA family oxidoreductase [Acidobacteriota bacterium]
MTSPSTKAWKAALIGCGRIGQRHAAILGASPRSELVATVDVRLDKAGELAGRHGGLPYSDLERMLRAESPDLLSVCTPSGDHGEQVLAASRAGVANVLVEKPMALTLSDADAMIAECDRNGTRLFVVKQNRYNLPILKLKSALDEGRFGRLVLGTVRVRWCRRQDYYDQAPWRGTWAMDGGVFSNQASHHIDMLLHTMGDVQSVKAMSATRLVRIEAEDTGIAVLKFSSGALGVIEATTAARPKDLEGSISILGEKGTVVVGGFAMNEMTLWSFETPTEEDARVLETSRTNPPDVYGFGHHAYYEAAFDAMDAGAKPAVDGREGRRSLEVITALYESIESGREISLPLPAVSQRSRLGRAPVPAPSA